MMNTQISRNLLLLLVLGLLSLQVRADKILNDLDFSSGKWECVAVTLLNSYQHPLQETYGTFIVRDAGAIRQMQSDWDLEYSFNDYCDYHYALKFYRDGKLQKTLLVNLYCHYISDGGLSYEFSNEQFAKYSSYFQKVKWSRIRFSSMQKLQHAIDIIGKHPEYLWYGDVKPYKFGGSFRIGMNGLPWNTNRDSLVDALYDEISAEMKTNAFYIRQGPWFISDDLETMDIRLDIFCDEVFSKKYPWDDAMTGWQSQFSEQDYIQIVVIGLDKETFFKLMEAEG